MIMDIALVSVVALLFAVIIVAHRKQSDALGILTAMSASLLAWAAVFKTRSDADNSGKSTQ